MVYSKCLVLDQDNSSPLNVNMILQRAYRDMIVIDRYVETSPALLFNIIRVNYEDSLKS